MAIPQKKIIQKQEYVPRRVQDDLRDICSVAYSDDSFYQRKSTDIFAELLKISDTQNDLWRASKQTDFSIYTNVEYIAELIYWYYKCSRICSLAALKWLRENEPKRYKSFTYFDDYPGLGLTTLDFARNGLDISFRSDVKQQINIFKKMCKKWNVEMPFNDVKLEGTYDVVNSFEVIEHMKDIKPYVDSMDRMLKPGGYLIESSGFGNPEGGPVAGHFSEYTFDGRTHTIRGIGRAISKYRISLGYVKLHNGFNGKPRVWQKPLKPKGKK